MKRVLLLLFIFVKTSIPLYAQYQRHDDMGEYSQSIGLSYLSVNHKANNYLINNSYAGLMYNLRVDFKLSHHSSVGLSLYPTFGFMVDNKVKSYKANAKTPTSTSSAPFFSELPIVIQFNTGNHSTRHTQYDFGSFIGAGASYNYYAGTKITVDEEKNAYISPGTYFSICATAGIKFTIKNSSYGIRIYYNRPFALKTYDRGHNFGISLLYNFSSHFRFG